MNLLSIYLCLQSKETCWKTKKGKGRDLIIWVLIEWYKIGYLCMPTKINATCTWLVFIQFIYLLSQPWPFLICISVIQILDYYRYLKYYYSFQSFLGMSYNWILYWNQKHNSFYGFEYYVTWLIAMSWM